MLNRVLQEIESTQETLNTNDLSQKLDIDRSVLDGMIQFWVRKGRLVNDESATGPECTSGGCRSTCTGLAECSFVAKMPKRYSLPRGSE